MKSNQKPAITRTQQYQLLFWLSHLTLIAGLLLWFLPSTRPFCQQLDINVFKLLNGSLNSNIAWQTFWGLLNHRKEVALNLVIAALFNVAAILLTHDKVLKIQRLKQTCYFWICFQIGFMIQEYLFNTLLEIKRLSPSLVLQPVVKLSVILQNPAIKDASFHSFPSGHAFALIYWAAFTLLCAPKKIANLGLGIALIVSLARLFSGAHWLSDTVFSALLALVWLSWTLKTPLYRKIIQR